MAADSDEQFGSYYIYLLEHRDALMDEWHAFLYRDIDMQKVDKSGRSPLGYLVQNYDVLNDECADLISQKSIVVDMNKPQLILHGKPASLYEFVCLGKLNDYDHTIMNILENLLEGN